MEFAPSAGVVLYKNTQESNFGKVHKIPRAGPARSLCDAQAAAAALAARRAVTGPNDVARTACGRG
eukprot:9187541-Pyramimonas_sp.AAC.1